MVRPKGIDLHYEVELALIIGKDVKDLEASDEKGALDAIESEQITLVANFPVLISSRLCC